MDTRGLWYPPDAVVERKAMEAAGVVFSEVRTPMDWTFLAFDMKVPLVLGPRQSFSVGVQRFGTPYGELKVVLDTTLTRSLY
jgi:hypothetical protein